MLILLKIVSGSLTIVLVSFVRFVIAQRNQINAEMRKRPVKINAKDHPLHPQKK